MAMVGRTYTAVSSYRYGFNGKEKDKDMHNLTAYDHGFRIYNPAIGKFLSVDPLTKSYPMLTPYQFASNTPISAIDLDGCESKIVIQETNSSGVTKITNETTYSVSKKTITTISPTTFIPNYSEVTDDQRGPLGEGTYTVTNKSDGTFTESWQPAEGNSVNPFYAEGVSQERWIESGANFGGLKTRLEARLIEKMTEDAFVKLGFDEKQIQKDISVLESDNASFKGKFASFVPGTEDKYTATWDDRKYSSPHNSTGAKGSGEIGSTGLELKYYNGAQSSTDDVPSQVGLVESSGFYHFIEAINALLGENTGLSNAKEFKKSQEKKKNP